MYVLVGFGERLKKDYKRDCNVMSKKIYRTIKKTIKYLISPKKYEKGIEVCGDHNDFIVRFIADRMHIECNKGDMACFSVYGTVPAIIRLNRAKRKFFYTAENTHVPESLWQQFEDIHLKEPSLSLSLGFDYYEHPRYLRIPYWMERPFGALATREDVADFINQHNYSSMAGRDKACAFVCKTDYFGDRAEMADMVAQVMPMSYPSDFRHNDDDMRGKYNNDKIAYLRQFKFNLCPENTNNKGYVTEKIFEAIKAGCVPIYWGNEGYPEPDILNPKAIVYLDKEHPEEGLALIKKLYEDPKAYAEFVAQPRFLPNAAENIYAYYERLENKINMLKLH